MTSTLKNELLHKFWCTAEKVALELFSFIISPYHRDTSHAHLASHTSHLHPFTALREARVFIKLDLRSAYNLICIRKSDEWKTAFKTPSGRYKYRVMPYGLKPNTLTWTPAALVAFHQLKTAFCTAPTLTHPDPNLRFVVEVDTSTLGVGAILSQWKGEPHVLHPCAYFSKKLSPAEQNYDIANQELFAIKLALEEWQHWLEGAKHPFEVITDHKKPLCRELQKGGLMYSPLSASPFWTQFIPLWDLGNQAANIPSCSCRITIGVPVWPGMLPATSEIVWSVPSCPHHV
ncbi:hypothetical protein M9458_029649, partial [Cirrhinus mrigala]